jgi:hypothetical protein
MDVIASDTPTQQKAREGRGSQLSCQIFKVEIFCFAEAFRFTLKVIFTFVLQLESNLAISMFAACFSSPHELAKQLEGRSNHLHGVLAIHNLICSKPTDFS